MSLSGFSQFSSWFIFSACTSILISTPVRYTVSVTYRCPAAKITAQLPVPTYTNSSVKCLKKKNVAHCLMSLSIPFYGSILAPIEGNFKTIWYRSAWWWWWDPDISFPFPFNHRSPSPRWWYQSGNIEDASFTDVITEDEEVAQYIGEVRWWWGITEAVKYNISAI